MAAARGIDVVWGLSGEAEAVLEAFCRGKLRGEDSPPKGCRRGRSGKRSRDQGRRR
jgi:hypothetical protein